MRAAGSPARSGLRRRSRRLRGAAPGRCGCRLSRAAQGVGRRRREGHAARLLGGRARRRVRRGERRGGGGVRRRRRLRREARLARSPRRDPGALRLGGRRADARRARVLDPAPPPEAHRGVAVGGARRRDARGDGVDRREGLRGDRLPQRRHVRVPRRPGRRLLLHRGELPAPGRASGVRARHRDRHRPRADPDRRRRAARRRLGARSRTRPRDRDPHQRGGSGARLPAGARDGDAIRRRRSARACASTPQSRRGPRSPRTTTR